MTSRKLRLPSRPLLLSIGAMLGVMLALPALAQQTPLTGRMLGNQPHAAATTAQHPAPATKPAPPPRQPEPAQTQPATTYPAHPMPSGQISQTPPPASPAPPPMPAYTDLHTMPGAPAVAETDTNALPPAAFGTPIGAATDHLLHLQASNRDAGPALPMLGEEADAAYKRYIDSFKHPIPEFFKTTVESGSGSGSHSGLGQ